MRLTSYSTCALIGLAFISMINSVPVAKQLKSGGKMEDLTKKDVLKDDMTKKEEPLKMTRNKRGYDSYDSYDSYSDSYDSYSYYKK